MNYTQRCALKQVKQHSILTTSTTVLYSNARRDVGSAEPNGPPGFATASTTTAAGVKKEKKKKKNKKMMMMMMMMMVMNVVESPKTD